MASGLPKPVCVLAGRDAFLRAQARGRLLRAAAETPGAPPAVTEFDASAVAAEVLDELRTLPLLAAVRVVVVDPADRFVRAHAPSLLKYLERPSASGVLVLVVDAWPPKAPSAGEAKGRPGPGGGSQDEPAQPAPSEGDVRQALSALQRSVRKIGEVVDCSGLADSSLPGWVVQAAVRRGKKMDRQAVESLLACTGGDLGGLDGEVEKLSLFVGSRETITREDVEAVACGAAGAKVFALSSAIAAGRTREALETLAALLVRRGDEFLLLAVIAGRLRWRWRGKDRGGRRVSPRRTALDFRRVLQADVALKSGADARTTMQWLVTALCQ